MKCTITISCSYLTLIAACVLFCNNKNCYNNYVYNFIIIIIIIIKNTSLLLLYVNNSSRFEII